MIPDFSILRGLGTKELPYPEARRKGSGRLTLVGTRKEKGVIMSGSTGPCWNTKQGYSMNPYNEYDPFSNFL